ncbi:hypothetical protein SDC9_99606 [bioreactor metagenome]|uniref:Uncharacterized protein n=1 Tax=bioreactor metagenome TaxID=1076179 RepID=A0A645AHZ9_9ZZZZ
MERNIKVVKDHTHHILRAFPILFVANVFILVVLVPFAEAIAHVIRKAQGVDHELREIEAALELLRHLIRPAGKVSFRDGELPQADQAMHLAAALIAKERARLVIPQRQVTIGTRTVEICHKLERAGHRAQSEYLRVFVLHVRRIAHDEHAVAVVIPVAGDLIQLTLGHKRRLGEHIAALLLLVLNKPLQQLDHARALRQQDRQALADNIHGGEELQLAAELIVVPLLRLFQRGNIGIQVGLLLESRTIDALEHLVLFTAAPVSARNVEKLDVLYHARALDVRAGAEINKVSLTIEADDSVRRQIANELYLIRFAELVHVGNRLFTRQLKALYLLVFLLNLRHLGLDLDEILRREGLRRVKIVIEPVLNRGADGELGLRPETLDRLREDMARGVAIGPAAVLVLKCVEGKVMVARDRAEGVAMRAVDGAGKRCPRKTRADFVRDFKPCQAVRKLALIPVRKCNLHVFSPPVSLPHDRLAFLPK